MKITTSQVKKTITVLEPTFSVELSLKEAKILSGLSGGISVEDNKVVLFPSWPSNPLVADPQGSRDFLIDLGRDLKKAGADY